MLKTRDEIVKYRCASEDKAAAQKAADAAKMSLSDFVREAVARAIRNAERRAS